MMDMWTRVFVRMWVVQICMSVHMFLIKISKCTISYQPSDTYVTLHITCIHINDIHYQMGTPAACFSLVCQTFRVSIEIWVCITYPDCSCFKNPVTENSILIYNFYQCSIFLPEHFQITQHLEDVLKDTIWSHDLSLNRVGLLPPRNSVLWTHCTSLSLLLIMR